MNKSELVAAIASDANLSKKSAEEALNSFMSNVKSSLKKEESVVLTGFGTFSVSRRAARNGRNPQTGAALKIPACKVPKFKSGKGLKEVVR
jgi:DNA-binding protein HU-beta